MTLGVDSFSAIIGYQVGDELVRTRVSSEHLLEEPEDVISPGTPIRLRLKGTVK